MPQQRELRQLHLKARQLAASADEAKRPSAYHAIVHAVCDMQWLGMRVGATEIVACVFAHHSLGQHICAIEAWREGVSRWCADATAGPGTNRSAVLYLFPQTHQYALAAAVALRNADLVREVYCTAARAMDISHQMAAGTPSQKLHARRAPLLWSLFPAGSRMAHRQIQALDAEPAPAGEADGAAERPWDAARLGSPFLAGVCDDARRWARNDGRLLSRIAQMLVRALFAEGRREPAMRLYADLRHGRDADGAQMTAEILCEVVGGLCRHAQLGDARRVLVGAAREHRGRHAWNSYFDGLANSIRRGSAARTRAASPEGALDRLRQAINEMEATDGLAPDAVARAIWLRACFRAGDWEAAERCFHAEGGAYGGGSAVLCDTFIRGALGSEDANAQRAGWQQIDRLAQRPTVGPLAVDRRLVETALRQVLQHLTAAYEPAYSPSSEVVERVFRWVESHLPLERRSAFAVVIAAQIRVGRGDLALELYSTMRQRGFSPPATVNSMVAAAHEPKGALAFAEANVPPQHYGAVYLRLLKAAVQHRRYDDAWAIVDVHYPLAQPGVPYPGARMYQAALLATRDQRDFEQHRLLLDRLRCHLDLLGSTAPGHTVRMARVYSYFRRRQLSGSDM